MARRRHTPDQIVRKLREADRLFAEGADVAEVARHLEVSEATYHRWRNQYPLGRPWLLGLIRCWDIGLKVDEFDPVGFDPDAGHAFEVGIGVVAELGAVVGSEVAESSRRTPLPLRRRSRPWRSGEGHDCSAVSDIIASDSLILASRSARTT